MSSARRLAFVVPFIISSAQRTASAIESRNSLPALKLGEFADSEDTSRVPFSNFYFRLRGFGGSAGFDGADEAGETVFSGASLAEGLGQKPLSA